MKQPYNWNYKIKIKTKDGTYEYEKDNILEAVKQAEQYGYDELYLEQEKPKTLIKRNNNVRPRNKN